MQRRSSKRLAGCFVIELVAAAVLTAADFEYKAGTARSGRVAALALEDRRGRRAVIAQAEFRVTLPFSDFVAARAMKEYGLERGGILIRSAGRGTPDPAEVEAAFGAALADLKPARVLFGGALSITGPDGRCRAALSAGGSLDFLNCGAGVPVRGGIRCAFQTVEPAHGLMQREDRHRSYPVQAIALGGQVVILALGGDAPAARFVAKGIIVATFANDDTAFEDEPGIRAAMRQVLRRVGR
jgi:hypothetical protein